MSVEALIGGALDYAAAENIADKAVTAVTDIGTQAQESASALAGDVSGMTQFQPFTVMTGTGGATTTAGGGYDLSLSPEAQALQNLGLTGAQGFMTGIGQDPMSQLLGGQAYQAYAGLGPSALTGMGVAGYQGIGQDPMQQALLAQASERFAGIGQDPRYQSLLSQADTAFSRASADPTQARADVYQQMRDIQRPEEERQALALEERMLAQGRLGLSSAAYGGASPELLAQEKARQEAMASANLAARQQVAQEQQQEYARGLGLMGQASGMRAQELQEATGLLGAGYTPQQMQLAAASSMFGAGMTQEQADLARAGALQSASYMPQQQDLAMATGLMGIGYTPQEQALAALGYGLEGSKLELTGQTAGAELFGQLSQTGLESQIQAQQLAAAIRQAQLTGMFEAMSSGDGGSLGDMIVGAITGGDE
jgi:hypothetical protein